MFEVFNVNVNILAIIVTAIVNIVIGMFWYSPYLFGNTWRKLVNRREGLNHMSNKEILFTIINALLITTGINSVLQYSLMLSGLDKFPNAIATSFMITLTFVITTLFNPVIFERSSKKLFLLNTAYSFVVYLLMSFTLTLFL